MHKKNALLVATSIVVSCIIHAVEPASTQDSGRQHVRIVATTFPIYDWTRHILGERLAETDLVLLQQNGADMHGYSPSATDLRKVAICDLFVFVGGDSDDWTERALAQPGNPNRRVLNLVKTLGGDVDEHVWLSLRHAAKLVKAIAAEIAALDPDNATIYRDNAAAYSKRIYALDSAYAAAVAKAKRNTILVADRFPFRDLAKDYGIKHHAAFAGCSAESEASFKTVMFLAKKADELNLQVILVIEGSKHRLAETVRRTTKGRNQRILALDSLQSTGGDAAKTTRYLDVMAKNLETLEAALN